MECPICGTRDVGRVGQQGFFCRECCVEFTWKKGQLVLYRPDEEGELIPVEPIPPASEVMGT
ncbi:MAG: hypothetical protein QJR00_05675 [Bacillota bacterium]|nr:hypothetical protein [Bacillota bacterium]